MTPNTIRVFILEADVKPGIYLKALCNGVDEVLSDYRKEIINLEEILLKNPQLTLTFLVGSMEKYVPLLNALKSMISFIREEQINGCLLIGSLHAYIDSGSERLSASAIKYIKTIYH